MADLAERLDAIQCRVGIPGMDIAASLSHRDQVQLTFGESVYQFLDEPTVELHLARLARLLYTEWLRRYRVVIADSAIDVEPHDQRDREFMAARAEIQSSGSAERAIMLTSLGLRDITVSVAPGALRRLSEEAFSAQFGAAAQALIADHLSQVRALRRRMYG